MGIVDSIKNIFKKKEPEPPKAVPTQQYSAPIGPTSKPDSSGIVSTPTGKMSAALPAPQKTGGGGGGSRSSGTSTTAINNPNSLSNINNAPSNVLTNKIASNKQSRLTPTSTKSKIAQANSISTYKPLTQAEKTRLASADYGKKGFKTATTSDLNKYGVTNGLTNVGNKYSLYYGQGTAVDQSYIPKITKFEAQESGSFLASIPTMNIQSNIFNKVQLTKQAEYQAKIDENPLKYSQQSKIDNLNAEFKADVSSVYGQELSISPEYKSAVNKYQSRVSGFEDLNKFNKQQPMPIDEVLSTALKFTPAAPIVSFSKGLKSVQENPNYYSSSGFTTTTGNKNAFDNGAFKINKQEGIDIGIGSAFALGATAGGFAVYGTTVGSKNYLKTGSLRGITAKDTELIKGVMKRKDVFKTELSKGSVTDKELGLIQSTEKGMGISGQTVKGGSSIRKFTTTIDMNKLTSAEAKALGKVNFKATTYQIGEQVGNLGKGFEVTQIRTGKTLAISKTNQLGYIEGQNIGGKFTAQRTVFSKTKGSPYTDVTFEKVFGTGKVSYNKNFRMELSKGTSAKFASARYEGNKLISTDNEFSMISSKTGIISKANKFTSDVVPRSGDSAYLGVTKQFNDVFGKSLGKNEQLIYSPPAQKSSRLYKPVKEINPTPADYAKNVQGFQDYFKGLSKGKINDLGNFYKTTKPTPRVLTDKDIANLYVTGFKEGKFGSSLKQLFTIKINTDIIPRVSASSSKSLPTTPSTALKSSFDIRPSALKLTSPYAYGGLKYYTTLTGSNSGQDFFNGFGSITGKSILSPSQPSATTGRLVPGNFSFGTLTGGLPNPKEREKTIGGLIIQNPFQNVRGSSRSKTDFTPTIASAQKLNQKLISKQLTKNESKLTSNPFSSPPGFDFVPPTGFGFPGLPGIGLFDYERKGRGRKAKPIKSRYAPSISAIAFNIKSPNIPDFYKKGAGAFGLRPIIANPFKSRRRKSSGKRKTKAKS